MNATLPVETQILATCLSMPGAIREVAGIIRQPDTFSLPDYRQAYKAMLELLAEDADTDLIAVNNQLHATVGLLKGDPAGWITFLTGLLPDADLLTGNLSRLCFWLIGEAARRSLLETYSRALAELQMPDTDPMELSASVRRKSEQIEGRVLSLSETPFSSVLLEAAELTRKAAEQADPITGIKTGFRELDWYLKGLHGSTSTILAARPAMGKTGQLCQMAKNIAVEQGHPVAIFSLEMKRLQLARRLLANDTGLKNGEVLSGMNRDRVAIDTNPLFESAYRIGKAPLFVYDSKTIRSFEHIRAKVNQLARQYPGIVVFIDYLQLVKTEDRDLRIRVTNVSEGIKDLANLNDIPIVSLAQLSREVEKRTDKRPMLSDLKESGSIEQDADNVIFLYRPAYYSSKDENGNPVDEKLLYNIVAKNRNGSTHNDNEAISLEYDMATNRIRDYFAY